MSRIAMSVTQPHAECDRPYGLGLPLGCALALMLCTFSMPGREAPTSLGGLDTIALTKLIIRIAALVLLTARLFHAWDGSRRPVIVSALTPFGLFVAWSIVSCVWSALPAVSIGQSLGLLTLTLLAANVALSWRSDDDTSVILAVISVGLLILSAVTAASHVAVPDTMGLNRGELVSEGHTGLVHPSTAGATAALGIIIVVAALLFWGWYWTWPLLVGCVIHASVLMFAASRTPVMVAAIILLLLTCVYMSRQLLGLLLVTVSMMGALYIAMDAEWSGAEHVYRTVTDHYQRGDEEEQLLSFSGRTDLWEIIWRDFLASPMLGHGYFITTQNGSTDVWGEPSNLTAHNLPLQILATTGLIGAGLFLYGIGSWFFVLGPCLVERKDTRHLKLLTVFGLWNLGGGTLGEGFMGGLYPEAVATFVALGIGIGAALNPRGERDLHQLPTLHFRQSRGQEDGPCPSQDAGTPDYFERNP
jgi:O-antigen ligase